MAIFKHFIPIGKGLKSDNLVLATSQQPIFLLLVLQCYAEDLRGSDLAKKILQSKSKVGSDILPSVVLPPLLDTFFKVFYFIFKAPG